MKKIGLYTLWAALYIVCVALGTITGATGIQKVALICMALVFFVPGIWLLVDAKRQNDRKEQRRIFMISVISLGITVVFLSLNFASVFFSEEAGAVLYDMLNLVSAPMYCAQYWVLSLFLWACLLVASKPSKKK